MPDFGKYKQGKTKILRLIFELPKSFFIFSLLGNYWIWNFWFSGKYSELLIMLTVSCLLVFFNSRQGRIKYFLLLLPLLFIFFRPNLKTIFSINGLEIYNLNQRRSYYQNSLVGRFFENKLNRYIYSYEKNLFEGLDINYYFFATHPRERVGIHEIEKFPELALPFFLIGLYASLRKKQFLGFSYFLFYLLIASFFSPIDSFSFLFFPFFVINIYCGAKECFGFFVFAPSKLVTVNYGKTR